MAGKRGRRRSGSNEDRPDVPVPDQFEAQVLPGVARLASRELEGFGARVLRAEDDALRFEYSGAWAKLDSLRLVVAVYAVLTLPVPRPKALLGHAHFTRIRELVERVRTISAGRNFHGFRFGAAGSDSPAFRRLATALEEATGLEHLPEEGELHLRFTPAGPELWEVLVRLTPRPLSARSWRVCNRPGGLNATVAAAALTLCGSHSRERHLNLMCGSGTLLIERAAAGRLLRGVGVDNDPEALACAAQNAEAAGVTNRVELVDGDATALPFDDGQFDRLSVDLPWGDAVGEHRSNARLYPDFLAESARVATSKARMIAVTHELKLFDEVLTRQTSWRRHDVLRVYHGGHRPGIYLLERR